FAGSQPGHFVRSHRQQLPARRRTEPESIGRKLQRSPGLRALRSVDFNRQLRWNRHAHLQRLWYARQRGICSDPERNDHSASDDRRRIGCANGPRNAPSATTARRAGASGFTLIEMILAAAVLGVILLGMQSAILLASRATPERAGST